MRGHVDAVDRGVEDRQGDLRHLRNIKVQDISHRTGNDAARGYAEDTLSGLCLAAYTGAPHP